MLNLNDRFRNGSSSENHGSLMIGSCRLIDGNWILMLIEMFRNGSSREKEGSFRIGS